MAMSWGCFRTGEYPPPLPRSASSRHRASAHPRQRRQGGQCLGGRCAVPGAAVLRLGGRGAARGWSGRARRGRRRPRRRPRLTDGDTMSMAARTDTQSPALHVADSHDLIRVHGARVNNLKDVSVEIPKRRLTGFTGVSGSGKSSLVFDTIAAESQRMINETYSAFVQGFMPTLARPDVDVLEGLTTAIIIDQQRMGADPAPRSAPPPTPTRCCAPCPPAPTSPTGPGRRGMRPGPATASLAGSAPGQAPGSDYPSWHRWPR